MALSYIQRINRVHDWAQQNYPSHSTYLAMFLVLNQFNVKRWPEKIQFSITDFIWLFRVSKKQAIRIRDELVEIGFLTYEPGRKGAPSLYSLGGKFWCSGDTLFSKKGDKKGVITEPLFSDENEPIHYSNNIYKTKDYSFNYSLIENDNNDDEDIRYSILSDNNNNRQGVSNEEKQTVSISSAAQYFQNRVNPEMPGFVYNEIVEFEKELGTEVCIRAFDEALANRITAWPYVKKILSNKKEQGIRSLAEWNEHEARRTGQKASEDTEDYWARRRKNKTKTGVNEEHANQAGLDSGTAGVSGADDSRSDHD